MYDCIRIISLRICSSLNKQLIALSHDTGQHCENLKRMIIQTLVLIVKVTRLFWRNDKHSHANIYNIEYSLQKFEDVTNQHGLTTDFHTVIAHMRMSIENNSDI